MDLEGKVAVITGGVSGIGKATAEKYIELGAEVVISDINEDKGKKASEELDCEFVKCDVTDYEEVKDLMDYTVDNYGRLDILVNSAGLPGSAKLEEIELEKLERIIQVNLIGLMKCCKAAVGYLKETEGCIINLASVYGKVGGPQQPAYSASKGGVVNFTRELAIDYAKDNVRVNSICPGWIRTPMTEAVLAEEENLGFKDESIDHYTPMSRVGEPEEIAAVAAFLATDEASYMTGENVAVDGGYRAI